MGVMSLREYLSERLTPHPLPTKDGGVLRTVGDARGYILTLPKTRKSRVHWKRASLLGRGGCGSVDPAGSSRVGYGRQT
jgi:hypothetical protein